MRILLLTALIACLVLVHSDRVAMGAEPAAAPPATKPLVVLTGAQSHVSRQQIVRIESADLWLRAWLDHLGIVHDTLYRPAMEVDFDRAMVIVIFKGKSTNSAGVRVESVSDKADSIVVRISDMAFQTAAPVGQEDHGQSVTPFAFIVLPKSAKPVVIEDKVQDLKDEEPRWQEIARLAAR